MVNYIKKVRITKGKITQEELARRVGVTRQTIIYIEKGKFNPSVKLALKIAKVLGCSVEELFELEEGDWI
ncbi:MULTISPECIES: helix-turn-helix transcriptional regulator [unclassified Kosmotoga]|uniref:helix-turn-helix transcriptional regulator n=1 Tax=unclassified Kosmotoga TaxID=2631489 RepID=UPI0007C50A24|nr:MULTISPECIES: helix-turn-helix transcriptional regulator [unclassified Kosmotoga]MDI3523704.1 putative transcriptional regulator [Kosmotoga sp.]MDK2953925.1 putative transcriptional regulator [Kosmotoga sp.]OAA23040.1 XRE family transcriptional regulator [Kosmotoga sp. DU53]